MTATVTIDSSVESVTIQAIAKALGVTGDDDQCRVHWANHLKKVTADLLVRGDVLVRAEAAAFEAVEASSKKISVS